ncbi:hypothetical protein SO802_010771 [Lithocarpus litseifolius]|uniref:Uncharacterized protein n=1 Tax=Lithocarpus litseifolius TaxID=425828 RepID=A0AAW2DGD7_9ROSI
MPFSLLLIDKDDSEALDLRKWSLNSEMRGCVLVGKLFDEYGIGNGILHLEPPGYQEGRQAKLDRGTFPFVVPVGMVSTLLMHCMSYTLLSNSICSVIFCKDAPICMTVDNLLLLPCTQALAQEQHEIWYNDLLDGSLRLLDVCGFARDALLQTKECTRDLQSTLRRRHGSKMNLAREVEKYLASRKVVKKAMQKALKVMQTNLNSKKNEGLAMVIAC